MRYGVIDVGSNTIRLIVCELKNNDINIILKEKELSVILNFIDNGKLSDEGAERLLKALDRFSKICELLACKKVYCFATASLRKISNTDEIVSNIRKIIPEMEIISGEDEAYYDFIGLKQIVKDKNGIGLDLGGGSIQIFNFKDNQIVKSTSLPLGGLEMKNRFVSMVYPTLDEIAQIKDYVKKSIKEDGIFKKNRNDVIYLMGGTARAVAKLHRYIHRINKKINKYYISIEELNKLTERFEDPRRSDIDILERIVPDRMNNILPSIIVLDTVCSLSGAKEVVVLKNGVRDGYIQDKILTCEK